MTIYVVTYDGGVHVERQKLSGEITLKETPVDDSSSRTNLTGSWSEADSTGIGIKRMVHHR